MTLTVELKEHIEVQLATWSKYFESRLASMERATDIAYMSMNERLAGMNEFRETLKDQTGRLATREELSATAMRLDEKFGGLDDDVQDLQRYRASMEGLAKQSDVTRATIISIVSVVLAIVGLVSRFF